MPKPYSIDLRERVVAVILSGAKYHEAAERFSVSVASISRWLTRHRRDATLEPARLGGHKTPALAAHAAKVRALVASEPDLTLDALRERLAVDGIETRRATLHRFLQSLGLTRKKRRGGPPSRTARTSPLPVKPGASAKPS
jgi:transposase